MMIGYLSTPLVGVVDIAIIGQLGNAALIGGVAVATVLFDVVFVTFNFLRSSTTGLTAQAVGAGEAREERAVFVRAAAIAVGCGALIVVLQWAIAVLGFSAMGVTAAWRRPVSPISISASGPRRSSCSTTRCSDGCWGGRGRKPGPASAGAPERHQRLVLLLVRPAARLGRGRRRFGGRDRGGRCSRGGPCRRGPAYGRLPRLGGDLEARGAAPDGVDQLGHHDPLFRAGRGRCHLHARGGGVRPCRPCRQRHPAALLHGAACFLDGIATAAEQLAGRAVGAGFRPAFERVVQLTLGWGLVTALGLSAIFLVAGPHLIGLMTTAGDVRAVATTYLPWAAFLPLAGVVAFQMDGIFIGATWSRDMRNMMLLSLVFYAAALVVLTPLWGNHGLWLSLLIFLGARSVIFRARMRALLPRTFGAGPRAA